MKLRDIRTLACASVALALSFTVVPALAGTPITYVDRDQALFSFDAPDDWLVRTGFEVDAAQMPDGETPAPRIISLEPERSEGVMWVGLWAPPSLTDLEDAADYISTLGADLLSDVEITSERTETVNGATVRIYSGRGVTEGPDGSHEVLFDLALMQLSGKVAAAAFLGEAAARAAHGEALRGVLASMRAVQ